MSLTSPQRIRRWYKYRIRRIRKNTVRAGLDPARDPYTVLLAKLSGISAPPKARQAYQQFMRESHATAIAPVVKARWEADRAAGVQTTSREPKAGYRAAIAREVFNGLSAAEQTGFGDRAKAEAAAAKAAYLKLLKDGPPQDAASRQKYVACFAYNADYR